MGLTTATPWGLVVTAPRLEPRVAHSLSRSQIPHRLFKIRENRTRRGFVVEVERPAWPSYVFIEAVGDWVWQAVLQITGVLKYVNHLEDRSPVLIPATDMERYIQLADANDVLLYTPSQLRFSAGDKVQVSGEHNLVFGHDGVYQCPTRFGHSIILMDWLGRKVPVEFRDDDLRVVDIKQPRRSRGGRRRNNRHHRQGVVQRSLTAAAAV